MPNYKKERFNFIKPTGIFALAGLFMGGFSAFALVSLASLLQNIGFDCIKSLNLIWVLCAMGSILLPIIFYKNLSNLTLYHPHSLQNRIALFNIVEYCCIQVALVPFFTTAQTLCFVIDGQNGIELIFTSWLALPCLLLLSYIFNRKSVIVEYS
ncbi:hypothetical protein HNQ92_001263 [Rhabdobacter roseus]|uniref:Uncharacterized protein n=1 Tax=Rhabdobacter roseus TaxID=1655419 RepID=A0A840TN03_9BACT|nr:hypothetical protein [Rhabdobacter roseus]MBB5283137.1 hypothetical protein [Rhabdobacter roseus]